MTLEEAKREIKELADSKWETFHNEGNLITFGEAMAYEESCHILDEIDAEPSGNPEQLTLTELARELRKIFRFRYLTACYKMTAGSRIGLDLFIGPKPDFTHDGYWANNYVVAGGSLVIPADLLDIPLDLSEYADENGNVDYSKCIVEVE